MSFELSGINDAHGNKNDISIMIGEQALNIQQSVNRDAVKIADDQNGGRRAGGLGRHGFAQVGLKWDVQQGVVETLERAFYSIIVTAHDLTEYNKHQSHR